MSEQSSPEPRRPLPGDEIIGPGDGSMCKSGDLALQDKLRSVQDRNESLERQLRERTIELQEANDRLQGEIAARGWIEAALGEIRLELELVVQERTADLHTATESLRQEIAERRRVEEALRESEAMLRAALDNAPFEFWIRDRDGLAIMQNAPCRRHWGDQIGKPPEDAELSNEAVAVRQADYRRAYAGEVVRDEVEYECGGEKRLFDVIIAPFLVDNEVRGILGFNIDITERKSAHDALRESEQKYRELVETANSIILRLDREGRIVFFNEYAQRFFGYKDDEILGMSAVGTIVPEVDSSGRDLTQMIRDLCTYPERFANNQNENVRRNGERVWIAWTNKLVFDDQREITGLLCIGNDVTKRKRAEEALHESELKYRMLFENMTAGFALHEMIYDEQGKPLDYRYLEINPAFERLTGVPIKTLLGKTVKEVLPRIEQYWIDVFGKVAQTGEPTAYQNYASELQRYYDVWAFSPAKDQVAVVFIDITDRKRAEDSLRQRAEELAALNTLGRTVSATLALEEAMKAALAGMLRAVHPDLAFLFQRDGERLVLNEVLPLTSRPRLGDVPEHRVGECICGLAVREQKPLYSRDILTDFRCSWEECKRAGIKSFAALPLTDRDEVIGVIGLASNTERDFESQGGFLETLASQVSVALANARLYEMAQKELADRKRADELLRKSEREKQAILNGLKDVTVEYLDPELRIIWRNNATPGASGCSSAEMCGKFCYEAARNRNEPCSDCTALKAIQTGRPQEGEVTMPSGRAMLVRSNPIMDADGRVVGVVHAAVDITERRRTEEKLKHMQVQLAHVARLSTVGELAAEIAHELSQPLYAILNYAKASRNRLAAAESPDLEGLRESNEKIERIATGASNICKRLRSFARRAESDRLSCDVNEIVLESVALMAFEARQKTVILETELAPIPLVVFANRVEIQQVFVNLLHNAIEAMEDVSDGVRRATIRTMEVGNSVEIVVSDNGPGLPSNDHGNIFEAFVTTKPDGLGMGLTISSTIVASHGGRLRAASNPQGGACFHCLLPLVQGDCGHGN